jgi:transcriptional regulator with XRE-family HTH domain
MAPASELRFSAHDSRDIASAVREEIARRRLSRQKLADEARISISTLEKALSGRRPFTLATIVRLEEVLGLSLRKRTGRAPHTPERRPPAVAPDELGNYARPSVAWLEGTYLTIIPSFGERGAVYAYRTDIAWDEEKSVLGFRESERTDAAYSHFGAVSVPNQTGHIYLVTNRHGQHRLAILARPTSTGEMHGVLTTLQAGRGAHLTPVAVPVVLAPLPKKSDAAFGRIAAGHPAYARYRALLTRTLGDGFAQLVTG